jgi:hypothetical protein
MLRSEKATNRVPIFSLNRSGDGQPEASTMGRMRDQSNAQGLSASRGFLQQNINSGA